MQPYEQVSDERKFVRKKAVYPKPAFHYAGPVLPVLENPAPYDTLQAGKIHDMPAYVRMPEPSDFMQMCDAVIS